MTWLNSECRQQGAIYSARYVTEVQMLVQEHWVGLTDIEQHEVIDFAQWSRFAVNSNNCEGVAVYLRIAWALLRSKQALGNAFCYGRDAATLLDQAGRVVPWQLETDLECPPGHVAMKGFVPARTAVPISPPPTPAEKFRVMELAALIRRAFSACSTRSMRRRWTCCGKQAIYALFCASGRRWEMCGRLAGTSTC